VRVDSSNNVSATAGSPYQTPTPVIGFARTAELLFALSRKTGSALEPATISSYRPDMNGGLTALATNSGSLITSVDSDVSGKFLYGTGWTTPQGFIEPALFGFSVNSNTGELTPLPGSPWRVMGPIGVNGVNHAAVSQNGASVCAIVGLPRSNAAVSCYARRPDGTLDTSVFNTPLGSNSGLNGMAITPNSSFVLATVGPNNQLLIAPLVAPDSAGQKSVASGGTFPLDVAISPSGSWVAVANFRPGTITIFSLDAAGNLTQVGSGTAVNGDLGPAAFSRSGDYLFASTTNGVAVFAFGSSGSLTPVATGQGGGAGAITSF
jgi:6-phosphogluconolactonase (cycloisomerase 2 family)